MTVSEDMQNIVTDLSAAIAGRQTYGRPELENLRKRLTAAIGEVRASERSGSAARLALQEVGEIAERGVAGFEEISARVRSRLAA